MDAKRSKLYALFFLISLDAGADPGFDEGGFG